MARLNKSRKRRLKYYSDKREEILEIVKSKCTPENRKTSNKAYYENVSQKRLRTARNKYQLQCEQKKEEERTVHADEKKLCGS